MLAADVDKVDVESIECDSILRELVQRCLLAPATDSRSANIGQRFHIAET